MSELRDKEVCDQIIAQGTLLGYTLHRPPWKYNRWMLRGPDGNLVTWGDGSNGARMWHSAVSAMLYAMIEAGLPVPRLPFNHHIYERRYVDGQKDTHSG